ncbi:DUF4382 domain-containing protein [Imperialibacter roseus]|uniref:DUF4382 domain-containing protein n=1 Tax=Imperialibacter roseus TaxID=1324217 RepID=A0ABZ0IRF5_9BACT|nr:DUF4382 domain-containing protein [Imperialibacter roseus]WOK07637.1 DUF4382 domain-containing protein [Imperialibacter roseus]
MWKRKNSVMSMWATGLLSLSVLAFTSCNKEGDENLGEGSMEIQVTDAPADNDGIEAVFVTVTNVKVDGQVVEGFEGPKTIDIMALQNGKTEVLATDRFTAKSYQNITLEIDSEMDEDGDMPGSYVEMSDGTKHKLASSAGEKSEYTFKGTSRVMADAKSTVVLDFDLRKFIRESDAGSASSFSFVSKSDLDGYLRFADEDNSGSVKGNYDGQIAADEKVIVYAYKKGSFNESQEAEEDASIQFKKAVASSEIHGALTKSFSFYFLEEGEYEFHFASYEENEAGEMELNGMIDAESETNVDLLNNVEIQAGVQLTLNVIANGI